MPIITKIREKSGLAIGLVALALALFVVGGDLLSPNSALLGGNEVLVGKVNGEDITYQEFSSLLENEKYQYSLQYGGTNNEVTNQMLKERVWEQMIINKGLTREYEKLGIKVDDNEIVDLVQGNNLHPTIVQMFSDPQSGEVDRNRIISFLKEMKNQPRENQISFYIFEQKLPQMRKQEKYMNLLNKTNYITDFQAKKYYALKNATVDIKYISIPYSSIPDSTVTFSQKEVDDYFEENKENYKLEENREIEYVSFSTTASKEDQEEIQQEIEVLKKEFEETNDDTIFLNAHSDEVTQPFIEVNTANLPDLLLEKKDSILKGSVMGPYKEKDEFIVYKILDVGEDSIFSARASHILLNLSPDANEEEKERKRKEAEDILQKLLQGQSFEITAFQYNQDNTRTKGGDLGWFSEGKMVKPFEKAVFQAKVKGIIPRVIETPFGYHLIKVTHLKDKKKYKIGILSQEIIASEQTNKTAYKKAIAFLTNAKSMGFSQAVDSNTSLIRIQALSVKPSSGYINNLTSYGVRQVVHWAYQEDREIEDISNVIDMEDQLIVVWIKKIQEEKIPSLNEVEKEVKKEFIKEVKANYIVNEIENSKAKTLENITSHFNKKNLPVSIQEVQEIDLSQNYILGIGSCPTTVGMLNHIKVNDISPPIKDENGVIIVQPISTSKAVPIADHSLYKYEIEASYNQAIYKKILEAIQELTDTKKEIYKYF